MIDKDNSVRAIDAYVESLDLQELGFNEYSGSNRGQSPYRRSDLLKLPSVKLEIILQCYTTIKQINGMSHYLFMLQYICKYITQRILK